MRSNFGKTNTELKRIARESFEEEYGIKLRLKDITLLEASGDGTYVMFSVGKREYQFNSTMSKYGDVYVGSGTLSEYKHARESLL